MLRIPVPSSGLHRSSSLYRRQACGLVQSILRVGYSRDVLAQLDHSYSCSCRCKSGHDHGSVPATLPDYETLLLPTDQVGAQIQDLLRPNLHSLRKLAPHDRDSHRHILVTFLTTNMVALVAVIIWRIPVYLVIPVWLVFAALDGVYLSSALTKVPDGAWFTLALAVILCSTFILWRFGKEQQWSAESSDRFPPSHMLESNKSERSDNNRGLKLTPAFGGHTVTRINGMGIFFDKAGAPSTTPTVFVHFLQKFHAAPDIVVFFHLRPLTFPNVPAEERYTVTRCFSKIAGESRSAMPNCYRLVIRHGYNDEVITRDLGMLVFEQIRNYVIREGTQSAARQARVDVQEADGTGASGDVADQPRSRITFHEDDHDNTTSEESKASEGKELDMTWLNFDQASVSKTLSVLQHSYNDQVVYVVGKEQMRISEGTGFARRVLLSAFLWIRENTRSKVQALNVDVVQLVEVGFVKQI